MSKLLMVLVALLMIVPLGSAFMSRNAFDGAMEENGVYYDQGVEMHVVKDVAILVECTVGMGSVNSTFNITEEAKKHLGFPARV